MNPVKIPNRRQVLQEAQSEASLYLREFNARRYAGFSDRIAKPFDFLNNIGIDKICELVEHGNGLLNIAELIDLSPNVLRKWLNQDQTRVQKVLLAKQFSGDAFAYKAERTLKDARFGTKEEILVSSKLADHYRWMAERLDRTQYGEPKANKPTANALVLNINYGNEKLEEIQQKAPIDVAPTKLKMGQLSIDLGSLEDDE